MKKVIRMKETGRYIFDHPEIVLEGGAEKVEDATLFAGETPDKDLEEWYGHNGELEILRVEIKIIDKPPKT